MADEPKSELAENSQPKKGRGPGKPIPKGTSLNPGGRPASSSWRAQNRAAAEVFLGQLLKLAAAGKLTVPELRDALADAATRGGYLTDEKLAELFDKQARTLAAALGESQLTEAQRTKIIDDFLARQREHLAHLAVGA